MRRLIAVSAACAAALLLTCVEPSAAAQDTESANYWLPLCRDSLNRTARTGIVIEQTLCGGMVVALGVLSCVPSDVTGTQAVRVVIAYVESRPAGKQEPFKALALEALNAAWPWPK